MITRVVLKGYVRVSLYLIDYIELTPQTGLSFILGNNGSGKSSLLRQLTPYPAHKDEFYKNGYKIIELTYEQKDYVLTSLFNRGTGTHSFFCKSTGIEHNPGGTRRVQIELVEKFFKWDKELMEALVGIKQFTSMSVTERRYWLQRLCPVDVTPAFELHKHCSSRVRDMKGAVRQLSDRLVRDAKDIVDNATLNQMAKDIRYHHDRLNVLYPEMQDIATADERALARYDDALEDAKRALSSYPELRSSFTGNTPEDYQDERQRLTQCVRDANNEERMLVERLFELTNEIEELKAVRDGKDNVDDLKAGLATLEKEREVLKSRATEVDYPVLLPESLGLSSEAFELIVKKLCQVLAGIPENEDKFTKERVAEAKAFLDARQRQIQLCEQRIYASEGRIENIRKCEQVDCPNCHHGFKPGVDPHEEETLLKGIQDDHTKIDGHKKAMEKAHVYLNDFDAYSQEVMAYQYLVREYSAFSVLWDYFDQQKVVTRNPRQHIIPIQQWGDEMIRRDRLALVEHLIGEHLSKIAFLEGIDKQRLEKLTKETEQLKEKHKVVFEYNRIHQQSLLHLEADYNAIQRYQEHALKTLNALEVAILDVQHLIEGYYQDAVKEEIQTHQTNLSRLNQESNRHQVIEATQMALEEERDNAKEDQRLYELLVDVLNPNTGLIADYLSASMGNCVKRMNAIIDHVWSYPIEIQTSPIDKDELTYRFPMLVGEQKSVSPDIKDGSSSQRDIVNFAFRLTVASCLEIKEFPLFIDELGAAFDERHRDDLVGMLDSMIEVGELKQVFFITHYQATHSAFKHADYIVLSESNVTVPRYYNQRVNFKEPAHEPALPI